MSRVPDKTVHKRKNEKTNFVNAAAASVLWSSWWEASGLVGPQPPAGTSCLILTSKTDFVRQGRGLGGGGVRLGEAGCHPRAQVRFANTKQKHDGKGAGPTANSWHVGSVTDL